MFLKVCKQAIGMDKFKQKCNKTLTEVITNLIWHQSVKRYEQTKIDFYILDITGVNLCEWCGHSSYQ